MKYDMTTPCGDCPFLLKHRRAYSVQRLAQFASGPFPCHKTADLEESHDDGSGGCYTATPESQHCAGALIVLEKLNQPHQMMRIMERLGLYDHTKLDMEAEVR